MTDLVEANPGKDSYRMGLAQSYADVRARLYGSPKTQVRNLPRIRTKAGAPVDLLQRPGSRPIIEMCAAKHGVRIDYLMSGAHMPAASKARREAIKLIFTHIPGMTRQSIANVFCLSLDRVNRALSGVEPRFARDYLNVSTPGFGKSDDGWREIVIQVAARHDLTMGQLVGLSRNKQICAARHECMYRLYHERGLSTTQVGRMLGGRDHTTICWGIKKHKQRMEAANAER